MEAVTIRELYADQQDIYEEFFLNGLIQNEDNFRMTPQDIMHSGFPTQGTADSFTLGAYINEELAGVVCFTRDGADREKLRHKGTLFRMYVAGKFSGKGLGKLLIGELLARVKQLKNVEQVNLTVVSTNHRAKCLYERFGFKIFSSEIHAIKWKGQYLTEEQMVLILKTD